MEQEEQSSNFFSTNLKWLRKFHQLSQEELASRVGLNRGNISSYESGMAEPKFCNLKKIATVFNLSVERLREYPLCCQTDFEKAIKGNVPTWDEDLLAQKAERIKEIACVIDSLKNCADYHVKSIEGNTLEQVTLSVQFQQLYKCSQDLIAECKSLLGEK